MPGQTRSSDRYFRPYIGSSNGETFGGRTTVCDPAYDSAFCRNLLLVEELTELFSLGIGRNGRRQSHSKTLRTSAPDAFPCARPCAGPAMEVVQLWRSLIQADLQDNSIT